MHSLGASVDDLNLELSQPQSLRPFVFGKEPRPRPTLTKEERVFEGPLERGADPAGRYFGAKDGAKYSLAERIEQHLPGSRRWLLEPLAPYLQETLPPVNRATEVATNLLQDLGLRRVSLAAIEYGSSRNLVDVQRLADRQLKRFSSLPSPLFLPLLVALYHEQSWHDPESPQAGKMRAAVDAAFQTLMRHEMFKVHPTGELAMLEWSVVRHNLLWKIRKHGHRSPVPPDPPHVLRDRPSLFCIDFDAFDDADFCASLRFNLSIAHLFQPRRTRFSVSDLPSEADASTAFMALVDNVQVD